MTSEKFGELAARATIDLNQAYLAELRGEPDRRNYNLRKVVDTIEGFMERTQE